jgi:hypothetical protein
MIYTHPLTEFPFYVAETSLYKWGRGERIPSHIHLVMFTVSIYYSVYVKIPKIPPVIINT